MQKTSHRVCFFRRILRLQVTAAAVGLFQVPRTPAAARPLFFSAAGGRRETSGAGGEGEVFFPPEGFCEGVFSCPNLDEVFGLDYNIAIVFSVGVSRFFLQYFDLLIIIVGSYFFSRP